MFAKVVILTDYGQMEIQNLHGLCVGVWNGHEFSTAQIQMTSVAEKLVTVFTDAGHALPCTKAHKFYIQNDAGEEFEVLAGDLKGGEVLIKREFPVIPGVLGVPYAYNIGFSVTDLTEGTLGANEVISTCAIVLDRLEWFAGLCDGAGYIYGKVDFLMVASRSAKFLREVMLMLQTLGVFSKVDAITNSDSPSTLVVDPYNVQKLIDLGLKFRMLRWVSGKYQRRDETVRVYQVIDEGRVDSTYCFTEHLRNKGTFNGIITGH